MTLLQDRPHIRSHRINPRDWYEGENVRSITDSDIRRARHRAENLTQSTQEISRQRGWVPGWDKVVGKRVEVLPADVPTPIFIPAHRSRWQRFKDRFTALWDWFVLSVCGVIFSFVLVAGGMLAAKVLVMLFQELFNGNV